MPPTARSTTTIGRADEAATIEAALASVTAGHGKTVVVVGEPGVGKSRLLDDARRRLDLAGCRVFATSAVEGGGPLRVLSDALASAVRDTDLHGVEQLQPYRHALARLLPTVQYESVAPPIDPVVLLGEGVIRLLRWIEPADPVALVLDDLHWADDEALAVVDYVAAGSRDLPLLLLLGTRADDGRPGASRLPRGADLISLTRLSGDEVAELASSCVSGEPLPDDVITYLAGRSEGLPLLVEELLAGLLAAGSLRRDDDGWSVVGPLALRVPQTLADLASARLAVLSEGSRGVVAAAAVLGRSVDWDVLAAVTAAPEPEIMHGVEDAMRVGLLEPDPTGRDRYRWRHGLVREAVLSGLRPGEARSLAARAADVVAGSDDGTDALAAELYERAGQPGRAAETLVRIATRAVESGSMQAAEQWLDEADALTTDPAIAARVATQRVRLLTIAGRAVDALGVGDRALVGASGEARDQLIIATARAAVSAANWDAALAYVDRATRPGPDLDVIRADALYGSGQLERAAELAQSAVDDPQLARTPELLCGGLEVLARCRRMVDPDVSGRLFRRAADVAEANGLGPARVRALFGLATTQLLRGRGRSLFEDVRELALDAGLLVEAAAVDLMLGEDEWLARGPRTGIPRIERAIELADLTGQQALRSVCLMLLAGCHAGQGDSEAARAALERVPDDSPNPDIASLRHGVRALGNLARRDLSAARDDLDAAIDIVAQHESSGPLPYWGLWALLRSVLDDRGDEARDTLRASTFATREVNRAGLLYADAVAAGRSGDHERAVALVAEGDQVLAEHAWWRRLLRLLVHQAEITAGWGDPEPGLLEDLAGFENDGSTVLATAARDLLRTMGAAVPRRGRGDTTVPESLRRMGITSREADVLRLVSVGHTNADVADRLFLSVRTVETHVASLLAKTRSSGRTELARYAASLNP